MEKCTCGRPLIKVGGVKLTNGKLDGFTWQCPKHGMDYENPANTY